jgi:tetratricopeptide (TPR) repeat protein
VRTQAGDLAAADAQYERAQQLFQRNPEVLNGIAAHMAEHGHAQKAISMFSSLAELEPASQSTMLVNMGNAYLQLNDSASALKVYQDALKVDPTNALAYRRLGDFEDDHGTTKKAADYFARACELEPNNPSHHACAGTAYLRQQDHERASTHLRKSLEIFPEQPLIFYNLAVALFSKGQAEGAIDELAKAVRLDPQYARAWYLKAQIELRLGRIDNATTSARRALASDSSLSREEVSAIHAFAREYKLKLTA